MRTLALKQGYCKLTAKGVQNMMNKLSLISTPMLLCVYIQTLTIQFDIDVSACEVAVCNGWFDEHPLVVGYL